MKTFKSYSLIIFFFLFFIVKSSFAVGCASFVLGDDPNWTQHVDDSFIEQKAYDACQSAPGSFGGTSPCSYVICTDNPQYYVCWSNDWSTKDQYFFYACLSCADAASDASSACGGDDEYTMDSSDCSWKCKCTDERAQASQECGGDDKYTIDDQTCEFECSDNPGTCPAGCETVCQQMESECGDLGYSVVDDPNSPGEGNCTGTCNVNPSCAQAYEQKCIECGTCDKIRSWNDQSCMGACDFDNCADQMDQADQACPFGYSMDPDTCEYTCKNCQQLAAECQASCSEGVNPTGTCHETNGFVDDFLCHCDAPNDCSNFYDACNKACSSPECGGVKTKQCQEDSGQVVYSKCQCNTCSNDPDPRDPSEPAPDPDDDSDLTGWVKAIKENTDTLISQGDDQSGWLEGIEANTDDIENLLGIIAKKDFSPEVKVSVGGTSVNTSGIIAAEGQTTASVDALKDGLSGTEITASAEGVESLGTTGDITGEGYTTDDTPATIALPAEQTLNDSFGTFTLSEENGYRDQVAASLSAIVPETADVQCSTSYDIPWFEVSTRSIITKNIVLDFCPYQSSLSFLGQVLVLLCSLRQLYLLAA